MKQRMDCPYFGLFFLLNNFLGVKNANIAHNVEIRKNLLTQQPRPARILADVLDR